MSWQPGQPVATAQDREEWHQWRRDSKREAQRQRRARYPRIDYYPDDEATTVIYSLSKPQAGWDLSSVVNRIVAAWAQQGAKLPPE